MYGFHVPARLATRISLCLLLMEFLSLSVARTYAQTDTVWQPVNGAWYGNWSDPSHWTNGVPNGNFNAYISNGSGGQATVHMDVPGVSVVNLTLDAGDLLDNSTGGPMFITGSLKNGGWFQLFPSSSLIDSGDVAKEPLNYSLSFKRECLARSDSDQCLDFHWLLEPSGYLVPVVGRR